MTNFPEWESSKAEGFEPEKRFDVKSASSHSPKNYFADYYYVRVGVAELRQIPELKPANSEQWTEMTIDKRIAVLQEAEGRMARVQRRPACTVRGTDLGAGVYGEYDGDNSTITVNTHPSHIDNQAECVNTVVHEGRHSYQDYSAMQKESEFHPDTQTVDSWDNNLKNIKNQTDHGNTAYMKQPIERDAGGFGFAVTQGLYPQYQPSNDRIDQYNSKLGSDRYGMLFKPVKDEQAASQLQNNVGQLELLKAPQAEGAAIRSDQKLNRRGQPIDVKRASSKLKTAKPSKAEGESKPPVHADLKRPSTEAPTTKKKPPKRSM